MGTDSEIQPMGRSTDIVATNGMISTDSETTNGMISTDSETTNGI